MSSNADILSAAAVSTACPICVIDADGCVVALNRACEQLTGMRSLTQGGRALGEAGITWIGAHSPQAKGRVERGWGTAQDRLVSELRRARAATLAEANYVHVTNKPPHN